MFGIIKNSCKNSCADSFNTHRINYCGTCKSIGKIYSQKSRIFLNKDIAFLSEILNSLDEQYKISSLDAKIISFNCFKLPDSSKIPISFRYTSAINVILANFKFEDNVRDENTIKSYFNRFLIKTLLKISFVLRKNYQTLVLDLVKSQIKLKRITKEKGKI